MDKAATAIRPQGIEANFEDSETMNTEQEFSGWSDSTIIANYSRTKDIRCLDELARRWKSRNKPLHVVNVEVTNRILQAMECGEQN